MKNKTIKNSKVILSVLIAIGMLSSCRTAVVFSASEPDADIFVNGISRGVGKSQIIKVKKDQCVNVKVEATGFLTHEFTYCYAGHNFTQKESFIKLLKDDAYEASVVNDYANKDFEVTINPKWTEADAWKLISQIITDYFDVLEMADKTTGYMKTSWQMKSFSRKAVRTRTIVKQSGTKPLKYKIKVISEYSDDPKQSVKNDDAFKEWDRILKAYNDLIVEFHSRLGAKN